MSASPLDADIAPAVSTRTRLSHRLARLVPTAPARLRASGPLVSFTFDDAPACACTSGADLLAEHGARGTYYVAGGLIGTRARHWRLADDAEIAALDAGGHEIGCHTHAHALLPGLPASAIRDDARRNQERLRRAVPGPIRSFAFPYGFASLTAKRALSGLYASSRGIQPGLNRGRIDRHFLRANPLIDGQTDPERIDRLMDAACAADGWLIFYGHDVAARPSPYGCTPDLLRAALRAAEARGIARVTVAEGLRRAA